jgi:hypothetical protein
MSHEKSKARFEFRTFGQEYSDAIYRMGRLSDPVPEDMWRRCSSEIYLISPRDDDISVTIRDSGLDIKILTGVVDNLEQWKPLPKLEFPIDNVVIPDSRVPDWSAIRELLAGKYETAKELLATAKSEPDHHVVRVAKVRHGFEVHDTKCEVATVFVNGARLTSLSSESTDPDAVKKTLHDTGLAGYENINYLEASKRVLGLVDKAFPSGDAESQNGDHSNYLESIKRVLAVGNGSHAITSSM